MCAVTPPAQIRLPDSAQAPATARAFLRGAACSTHQAPITVRVECDGSEGLRVSVTDGDPEPPIRQEPSHDDATGRGIALVDVLSNRWGVHARPGEGKEVWFQLRG